MRAAVMFSDYAPTATVEPISLYLGAPASLDGFRPRVAGIGPQIGYVFRMGDRLQGNINLKGYREFAVQNRPEGWTHGSHSLSRPPSGAGIS